MRGIVRENWDKLIADSLLIVYGVGNFLVPTASTSGIPTIIAALFNLEFILCGALLVIGTLFGIYRLKQIGLYMYILVFALISLMILLYSGSLVSVFIVNIALQGLIRLREMIRARKQLQEINEITRDVHK